MSKQFLNKTRKFTLVAALFVSCLGCGSYTNTVEIGQQSAELSESQADANVTADQADDFVGRQIVCGESEGRERRICDAAAPEWEDDVVDHNPFKITYAEADLNNDGIAELIAWESSWAGSSGGLLAVLRSKESDFELLYQGEMTWSPILILRSIHNGWSDLAYLQTGGGVKPTYMILRFENKKYSVETSSEVLPEGKVVIGKNWESSVFGPTGN